MEIARKVHSLLICNIFLIVEIPTSRYNQVNDMREKHREIE